MKFKFWKLLLILGMLYGCDHISRLRQQMLSDKDQKFSIHFIDVGIGDSAIIDIGDKEILIDGGLYPTVLYEYVKSKNIIQGPIELVILTHSDPDHWKGLNYLLVNKKNQYSFIDFWEPGYDRNCEPSDEYSRFIENMRHLAKGKFIRPLENTYPPSTKTDKVEPFYLPDFPKIRFTLLYSSSNPQTEQTDDAGIGNKCEYIINNSSIVLAMDIDGSHILFPGDASGKLKSDKDGTNPIDVEENLLRLERQFPGLLKTDVLKVPHHGSETASTRDFISRTDPKYVVISASKSPIGSPNLPKESVVERYKSEERIILRTDRTDGKNNDHISCATVDSSLQCKYLVR